MQYLCDLSQSTRPSVIFDYFKIHVNICIYELTSFEQAYNIILSLLTLINFHLVFFNYLLSFNNSEPLEHLLDNPSEIHSESFIQVPLQAPPHQAARTVGEQDRVRELAPEEVEGEQV